MTAMTALALASTFERHRVADVVAPKAAMRAGDRDAHQPERRFRHQRAREGIALVVPAAAGATFSRANASICCWKARWSSVARGAVQRAPLSRRNAPRCLRRQHEETKKRRNEVTKINCFVFLASWS
jgi:hypothetical protein